jgi:mercuric ion binding protein
MAKSAWIFMIAICLIGMGSVATLAAEQKVTLMLGGKFCDAYLGDVKDALTKVDGVKNVDLKSMKGHAIVTIDGEKAKPANLAKAVNGVKGDGWHCTGEVMK